MSTYLVTALDGAAYGMMLFVVAAGLALVYGVMGELNLAHGSLYLVGAYLAHTISRGGLGMLGAALAIGVLVGVCAGVVLATMLRPVAAADQHLHQALITIGLGYVVADLATAVFGAAPLPVAVPISLAGTVHIGVHGYPVYRLGFLGVAALIAAVMHWVVRRTPAGVTLRAVVADPQMAAATGVATARVRIISFAAGAALAVAGGVLGAPLLGPAPGTDTTMLVSALVIVVIGGAGSVPATLAAALLVGQVQTLGVLIAPALAPFALFTVVVAALVLRRLPSSVRPS